MPALRARHHPASLPLLAIVTLLASACESACLQPPCPLPLAITVTVTSSVTGDSIPGAFVQQNAQSSAQPCTLTPGTTCDVMGGAGSYDLTIGAPGFQTIQRTVVVPVEHAAKCGCSSVQTQHLDVALAPTA